MAVLGALSPLHQEACLTRTTLVLQPSSHRSLLTGHDSRGLLRLRDLGFLLLLLTDMALFPPILPDLCLLSDISQAFSVRQAAAGVKPN